MYCTESKSYIYLVYIQGLHFRYSTHNSDNNNEHLFIGNKLFSIRKSNNNRINGFQTIYKYINNNNTDFNAINGCYLIKYNTHKTVRKHTKLTVTATGGIELLQLTLIQNAVDYNCISNHLFSQLNMHYFLCYKCTSVLILFKWKFSTHLYSCINIVFCCLYIKYWTMTSTWVWIFSIIHNLSLLQFSNRYKCRPLATEHKYKHGIMFLVIWHKTTE